MVPERQIIEIGLTKMRRYIRQLQSASPHRDDRDAGEEIPETVEQTFRRLVVLSTNLANHMIGRRRLSTPSDRVELFTVLSQAGILPPELAERLRDVAVPLSQPTLNSPLGLFQKEEVFLSRAKGLVRWDHKLCELPLSACVDHGIRTITLLL
ncbi:MAG: hypothetical protein HY314_11275 [Acidobacteria bacterium]|nr:hypothetical protein [Acidobacteriota bacterium]